MNVVGHIGIPIYKGEDESCEWCSILRTKSHNILFPVCRNPEAIMELRPKHLFILRCDSECQYVARQSEHSSHYQLIGKYLDKYSDDGYVLIPDSHILKLMEKMGTSDLGAGYVYILMMSYGWYQIDKPEHMDEGTLFTNKQNKELMSSRSVIPTEAV